MNKAVREAYEQTTEANIYPIDVHEMAGQRGIEVMYFDPSKNKKSKLTDVSGMLDKAKKIIYVNINDSLERQRFTIAHELGHYLFDHSSDEYGLSYRFDVPGDDGKKPLVERQADNFAAELLMPSPIVRRVIKRYKAVKLTLNELATLFGVSRSAMNYRLRNLGLQDRIIK